MKKTRFFIIGSQRTGTTLLRLILNSHPGIRVHDEPENYGLLHTPNHPTDTNVIGYKIPAWTYAYAELKRKFPSDEVRFIFMFRDIRAIVPSMLRVKNEKGETWSELSGVDETSRALPYIKNEKIREKLRKCFVQFTADEIEKIPISVLSAVTKSLFYWQMREEGYPVIPIRYEHLVYLPEETIERVLHYLDVPWHEDVMQHHQLQTGPEIGNTPTNRAIDTASTERWKNDLSVPELKELVSCFNYFENFISTDNPNIRLFGKLWFEDDDLPCETGNDPSKILTFEQAVELYSPYLTESARREILANVGKSEHLSEDQKSHIIRVLQKDSKK